MLFLFSSNFVVLEVYGIFAVYHLGFSSKQFQSYNKSLNCPGRILALGLFCAQSVLSRPRADILPVRPSCLVNKIYVIHLQKRGISAKNTNCCIVITCMAIQMHNIIVLGGLLTRFQGHMLERFSAECGKTNTKPMKVISLANHKGRIQYSEPIKT